MNLNRYENPTRKQTQAQDAAKGEWGELGRLLFAVLAIVLVIVVAFDRAAWWLAPRIPFEWERRLAASMKLDTLPVKAMTVETKTSDIERIQAIEAALQQRVDRISQVLGVPEDMTIRAHYVPGPTVNAVATLGGHVSVFGGLLSRIEYLEELDAVLAHEIGHVTQRHLVRHLSRGVTTAVVLQMLGIHSSALTNSLVGNLESLQQLAYSRDAEREADQIGQAASMALYGHTQGMVRLFQRFEALQAENGGSKSEHLTFLQSHPLPQERIQTASQTTTPPVTLTPLPPAFRAEGITPVQELYPDPQEGDEEE